MASDLNSLRVYALGLAHRAVSDISRDGFRQLRNYVDMCAFLSNSDAQKDFFDRAQTALEKTDSLYYPLIQRTLSSVSADTICTVGVNLGIDALTYGGSRLKKTAQESGRPVAWLTLAAADEPGLHERIAQGEAIGQYLWLLTSPGGSIDAAQELAGCHRKCNVGLLIRPEDITPEKAVRIADTPNLVPILLLDAPEISESAHTAALLLQGQKVFFGMAARLTDATADSATNGEWLEVLAQHTLFCAYYHPGMSPEAAVRLRDAIYRSRTTTGSPVLLLDWEADTVNIGSFISPLAQVEFRTHLQA